MTAATASIPASLKGERLDRALAALIRDIAGAPLSRGAARSAIEAGSVRVNGSLVRVCSRPVYPGQRLSIEWSQPTSPVPEPNPAIPTIERPAPRTDWADRILFEDEALLVVNKPPGLPSQPTPDPARENVLDAVLRHLADRGDPAPNLRLVHRLDRDTGGVLVFTRTLAANGPVSRAFANRRVTKRYLAVVAGVPSEPAWRVDNHLDEARASARHLRMVAVHTGGKRAITAFTLLGQRTDRSLVLAEPETGRTHQIRVHLADAGLPILGDDLYAPPAIRYASPRLLLHAWELSLPHPTTGELLRWTAPMPQDFGFESVTDRLSQS